jgi:hypothetical protein
MGGLLGGWERLFHFTDAQFWVKQKSEKHA